MPTFLLAGSPGSVIAMTDPSVQGILPPLVTVDPSITFQEQKSLITRIMVAQETNFQFLQTIGGAIYIYVFGDRVGQMTISGISAAINCADSGDTEHGFEKMLSYYNTNKLSNNPDPVSILIGSSTTLTGFITGIQGVAIDPKLMLIQFDLNIMLIPQPSSTPDSINTSGGNPITSIISSPFSTDAQAQFNNVTISGSSDEVNAPGPVIETV